MTKVKTGDVKEFVHRGVTGVQTLVEVPGLETWDLGCLRPGFLVDMEDLKEHYRYERGRWQGDWRNPDPKHVEFMQRLLSVAHEKLLPYVKALRANDNAAAFRTPD